MQDGSGSIGRRSVNIRLEPEMLHRLEQLSTRNGATLTETARALLEHALDDAGGTTLLALAKATEHHLAGLVRTLEQHAARIERLVCAADANAARRHEMRSETLTRLLGGTQRQVLSARQLVAAILEALLPALGLTDEQIDERHRDYRARTAEQHAAYLAEVTRLQAEVGARAPAPLLPPSTLAAGRNGAAQPADATTATGDDAASPEDAQLTLPVEEA